MDCTGIFVISRKNVGTQHADFTLRALRAECDRLIIVTSANASDEVKKLAEFAADEVLFEASVETSYLAGVRRGLLAVLDQKSAREAPVVVTGAHVLGPIGPIKPHISLLEVEGAQVFSCYWHNTTLDPRLMGRNLPNRLPYLDFAIFMPSVLCEPSFRAFWSDFVPVDYWSDLMQGMVAFSKFMDREGLQCIYPIDQDQLKTSDPRLYEIHTLVDQGAPCLPLAGFTLDPLIHDLNAIAFKRALDGLRVREPELYKAAIRFATRNVAMREFNAISDQFEIFPVEAAQPEKSEWTFGTIAVFIHVYYPEMLAELAGLVSHIPAPVHLFITTANPENQKTVQDFFRQQGYAADAVEVRVVEQNRGRDMSSLFITFRDVILKGTYEVALRLHSKRTPQVTHRVAESFKAHLFENLAFGPGYVSNLLDRLEAEPDIGLVIPPVVHIGFGTLGHSWFNNFNRLKELADEMGLQVPFDTATPVAPYGTMFWFRTDALRQMFEWPWRWEDYNEEPRHIDGGLAHVQERLIGYCVQDRGYRVLSVMTPDAAARGYAKLEYKMQRLVSHLSPANIIEQDRVLAHRRTKFKARLYHWMMQIYGNILVRWPGARHRLRPVARVVSRLLAPGVK